MEVDYIPFKSLLSNIVDNRGKTCPTAEEGIPLIATNCIKNDLLYPEYNKLRFVSQKTFDTWFRGHPEPGDIIFVTKGSPGRVCIVPDPLDFCIAQDMVAIRADDKKVYPKFLFALLRSQLVQSAIESLHVGTMIPHFKKGDFDKLSLPIPDRKTQEYIGNTYFTISAKIELNQKMNKTLDEIAQAIFKSWFVDFDGATDEDLIDSEFGRIPSGWRPGVIGELLELAYGKSLPQKKRCQGEVPVYGSGGIIGYHNSSLVEGPSIIIGRKGSVGTVYWESKPFFPIDTTFFVRSRMGREWFSWFYYKLLLMDIERLGADSAVPGVNRNSLLAQKWIIPPVEKVREYNQISDSIRQRIDANARESLILASLRDTLIPRIISGEIRVPDAEKIVEAVV